MQANYHTHTVRCHHAEGTEREYIEQAIARKLETLGFSDHSPQVFDGGYVSGKRMLPEQLEEYVATLQSLREEYAGRIEILIGLEAEYYPKYFGRLMDLIRPYHLDYLLLGQHYLGNEEEGLPPCPRPTEDEGRLEQYVRQVTEGMETGAFSCVVHPDILNYTGDRKINRKWYEKLCVRAKELDIPLEINLLGVREDRNYPNDVFWEIAAREGNMVIYGSDAHRADHVCSPDVIHKADRFRERMGIPRDRLLMELPL